ncbi:MAG: hypothetical protein WBW77_16005 [Candidatus Sulfotelmatobacter sp.]
MSKILSRGDFDSKSTQVIDDMANINLQNVAGLPIAKCYSEYIESRKKKWSGNLSGRAEKCAFRFLGWRACKVPQGLKPAISGAPLTQA